MKDRDLIYRVQKEWNAKTIRVTKAGGQTNRNYIVEYKNKKFFVRLPWENKVIDRCVEGKNIVALSKNKKLTSILPAYHVYVLKKKNILAPKSRDVFNVPDGTMVTEYIEGTEFSFGMFKEKAYQERLVKMFHVFHISGVRFSNTYDVFRDEIEKYRLEAQRHRLGEIADKPTIGVFQKLEKEAKAKLHPLQEGISTHNDFIFQNFLVGRNKKICLLDFEYAGFSKRGGIYYDFGFLFADNVFRKPRMTKDVFESFLVVADSIYSRRLDREQIYAAALAVVVMQFWWGIVRYLSVGSEREKRYFLKYVQERVRGISLCKD